MYVFYAVILIKEEYTSSHSILPPKLLSLPIFFLFSDAFSKKV